MDRSRVEGIATPLLMLGGIGAAFGLASCCALPLFLYLLGIGSAWLGGIGLYAAFHETAFQVAALVGPLGRAALLVWQRQRFTRAMLFAMGAGLVTGAVLLWAGPTHA